MKESLLDHERRMLVLAYLKALAEDDPAGAQEIRGYANDDPELGQMLDLEDDEATRRAAQDSRIIHLVAAFFSKTFSIFQGSR